MAKNNGGSLPKGQRAQGRRASRADVLENQRKAITLRAAGATYDDIAKALGYSDRSNARKAVMAALEAQVADDVAALRTLQGARLDRLLRAVWSPALNGSLEHVDRVLRILERQARLYGLDAPTKIEMTDEMDREIALLAAKLGDDGTWDVTGIPDDTAVLDTVEEP